MLLLSDKIQFKLEYSNRSILKIIFFLNLILHFFSFLSLGSTAAAAT